MVIRNRHEPKNENSKTRLVTPYLKVYGLFRSLGWWSQDNQARSDATRSDVTTSDVKQVETRLDPDRIQPSGKEATAHVVARLDARALGEMSPCHQVGCDLCLAWAQPVSHPRW